MTSERFRPWLRCALDAALRAGADPRAPSAEELAAAPEERGAAGESLLREAAR